MRSTSFVIPFRLRLVFWYGALVLVTLVVLRLVSAEVIRRALYEDLDASLATESSWVRYLLGAYPARGLTAVDLRAELVERNRHTPRKTLIEIRMVDGRLLYHSQNIEPGALSVQAPLRLGAPETVRLATGLAVRRLAVADSSHTVYVAHALADVDNAVDNVLLSFVWLIPLALLLAVGGGFLLVTRFMAPIASLNRYADRLVSIPLHETLPTVGPVRRDEIGRLVGTVTGLVERMRSSLRQVLGFSTLASHELRTPLATMRSRLEEALRTDRSARDCRTALAHTYDDVLRLSRISEDLLSLGTLHAGTFQLQVEPTDLQAFLLEFAGDAQALCEPAGITFTSQIEQYDACMLDPRRIRQVLFNLLDNAIRHTPAGGNISIASRRTEGLLEIVFSDTGSGISAEQRHRVFDPFYSGIDARRMGGTGLGLALVKAIVEAHGGSVGLESEPGLGTRVTLRLPYGRAPEPALIRS